MALFWPGLDALIRVASAARADEDRDARAPSGPQSRALQHLSARNGHLLGLIVAQKGDGAGVRNEPRIDRAGVSSPSFARAGQISASFQSFRSELSPRRALD